MAALLNPNLFDPFVHRGTHIVLAVSGGGDSMALLDHYRLARLTNINLPLPFAVSVDHGLRSGFAREAALVEAYCAQHNLPWQLVHWPGEKPKTGIMAAARMARYRLLADAAFNCGAEIILTGHTLDDQIETAIMRAKRGADFPVASFPMESDVLFERRVMICRPLLSVSRAELRAHLVQSNIAFADDPTNVDMRYERARVRSASEVSQVNAPEFSSAAREDIAARAAAFFLQHVKREGDSVIIQRPHVRDNDAEIFGLRYLAASLGGFDYPAPANTGERLAVLLGEGHNGRAYTAQRCRFVATDEGIKITPDPRHVARPWLQPIVQPFEAFCAKSMAPLANALAKIIGAAPFYGRDKAAI